MQHSVSDHSYELEAMEDFLTYDEKDLADDEQVLIQSILLLKNTLPKKIYHTYIMPTNTQPKHTLVKKDFLAKIILPIH